MTPKQRAHAWALLTWGAQGVIARSTIRIDGVRPYLIGELNDGFLGAMLRYYGYGSDWDAALTDAIANHNAGRHRGTTNGFTRAD